MIIIFPHVAITHKCAIKKAFDYIYIIFLKEETDEEIYHLSFDILVAIFVHISMMP